VSNASRRRPLSVAALLGPGLLVAATGVGAGDLATAAFTGGQLGLGVLWAVLLGAFLKFVLNEGLARWQIATGSTLLEGVMARLTRPVHFAFLAYFVLWSFFVGSALMSACGAVGHAMFPLFDDADRAKLVFGVAHSVAAGVLVLLGGFALFEKVMRVCIAVMFATVLITAVRLQPDFLAVVRGLFIPTIPHFDTDGISWTIALMGGVGGTLTVLCYGYWLREQGRDQPRDLGLMRTDLAIAYTATAVFGVAMVILGNATALDGKGAGLIVALADRLETVLGVTARWVFILGAWGAVFTSMLGVWQSVPYLFSDFLQHYSRATARDRNPVDTRSLPYRGYLFALATIPALGMVVDFRTLQQVYAIIGAAFMPMLAAVLLYFNGRADWVGKDFRNGWATRVVLLVALVFFLGAGFRGIFR